MDSLLEKSSLVLRELHEVFNRFDFTSLEKMVEMIDIADRIFLMGIGREGLATRAFAMRLMHCGKMVYWCWDDTTPSVGAGDLFIFTSGSGEIGHIHYVMQEVRKTDANIILITGVPNRKSAMLADQIVAIPATVFLGTSDSVTSFQPMGNLFEQSLFILLDLCIIHYIDTHNLDLEEIVKRHRNFE